MGGLMMWRIDDGGEVFWVAAWTADQALAELTLCLGEGYSDGELPDVSVVDEPDLDRIKIAEEGGGPTHTLREELAACVAPMLVGGTCF